VIRLAKKRTVDFSLEEMLELTGLTRKQFHDALVRFCDMYDFRIVDFKVDESKEKSDYFFPPEIAEPLALMLKHLWMHPLYRKNTDPATVTATALAKYNAGLLKDIDESLPTYFNHAIYSLPGQLVAQEIADWTDVFVRELTHFIYNLSNMERQNMGATLKMFTQKLDEMNYYLHRGNYMASSQIEANREWAMKTFDLPDDSEIDKKLQEQNYNIDRLLAELIRWELRGAHDMRERNFPELKDILGLEDDWMEMLGAEYVDVPNPSAEEQREEYYSFVLGHTVAEGRCRINKNCSEKMKDFRRRWKPSDVQIREGIFPKSTVREEYRTAIKKEMSDLQEKMNFLQRELDTLDEKDRVPFTNESDEELEKRQADYVEYCKEIDENQKRLYEIVDHFVGQAINEFLK
jgi:hypothetical protein